MTTQELRKQMDSFFEGKLSDSEEQALKDYLASHEVPPALLDEKRLVLALMSGSAVPMPEGLEERMSSFIDRLPAHKRQIRLTPLWRWVGGVAAGLVLAASVGISIARHTATPKLSEQEMYACAEAQRALILVSQKLNEGTRYYRQACQKIAETDQHIKKYIKY